MFSFLFIFLLCFFSSCGKSAPPQQEGARLSLSADPTVLDPRRARDLDSTALVRMLFEGLTRPSRLGTTELALAEKVDISEDGLRYIFYLRKSQWSDGSPLTAVDFEESWKTILDPSFPTDIAYQLYPIKNGRKAKAGEVEIDAVGVKSLDEQTLAVELEQPIPYFLEVVSTPSFFPVSKRTVAKNGDWSAKPDSFVSNGPFVLRDWKHGDRIHLAKNPYYWEVQTMKLASIDFYIAPPNTALQMYEEGKLDWAGSPLSTIPADAIQHLKRTNRLEVSPFLGTYFFRVNTLPSNGGKENPLANRLLRRAMASAIDREGIVQHVLQGGQKAAWSLVPPEMGLNSARPIDLETEGCEKCGDPIVLSYLNNERNAAVAQAVQKQWEDRLGISIQLEAVEPKVFFQRVSKKEYQIAAGSWTADFNDPVNFLEVFKHKEGSTNNTGWENLDYIDLLNRSALCKVGKERDRFLQRAEAILMEDMPIIPVFHFVLNYAKNPRLAGVALSPIGQLDLRWAYFEKSHKDVIER